MRRFAFALLPLLLAACASHDQLNQLKLATPPADPYQSALVNEYQLFAEQKTLAGEADVADYFAEKGLVVASGAEVTPEMPDAWDIAPAAQPLLAEARGPLMEAVAANQKTQPALSAQAVVAYDRWVEASANSDDAGVIAQAHTRFTEALAKLGEVQAAQPGTDAPLSEPGVSVGKNGATLLYFPFDSDRLGSTAQAAIGGVAAHINAQAGKNVNINGHADRAGSEAYNQNLSERRARFVEGELVKAGVPKTRLHYFAFGESDPAVPTADGVQEPRNRRVEIVIE